MLDGCRLALRRGLRESLTFFPVCFQRVLGTPVVLVGFANPDDQAHAPNESLVLANYEGGTRTIVRYWCRPMHAAAAIATTITTGTGTTGPGVRTRVHD